MTPALLALALSLLLPATLSAGTQHDTFTHGSTHAWVPVWSDEFDGDVIDRSKWQLETNCWGGGNAEQQCYTDRSDTHPRANAFVADGLLHIVARKENFTGVATPTGRGRNTATLPFTSARLRTRHRQEWTFGRFEIRAKLPRGQGSWPAIWMLPTDSPYGTWASSGEIDIMEAVNLGTQSDEPGVAPGTPEMRVHGTLHYGGQAPRNVHAGTWHRLPDGANPADDFHVYALEWEAGEIRWYVDGVHYATQRADTWFSRPSGNTTDIPADAPFDAASRYHLLINLAVGGNWAGRVNETGIDPSAYPQTLLVDYVRVFRCDSGSADGTGCATRGPDATLVAPTHAEPAD